MPLLDVKNLRVRFETHHGTVKAVDGVSFRLEEGETLGLVGESGSGKSVTNLALMGLVPTPPGVVQAESVRFGGKDLSRLGEDELRRLRGNEIAMIFQDPMTSLNPLLTVERQLTEVLVLHKGVTRREARTQAAAGLGDVGIPNPEARLDAFPHELSGGMRQRVMIAMGLLCRPRLLIADEPTTALDVTIQAQILELMKDLQHKHGMAIILVTHDLGVVAGMTDRINVMYAGRLAETANTEELFARPMHPYTKGLLESVPTLAGDPDADLFSIPGSPPDLAALPTGCAFAPRCTDHTARCDEAPPALKSFQDPETRTPRRAACFELDLETQADPNRELFAALERQEREGLDTGVVTWTKDRDGDGGPAAVADEAAGAPESPGADPDAGPDDAPPGDALAGPDAGEADDDARDGGGRDPQDEHDDEADGPIPALMGGPDDEEHVEPEVTFVPDEALGLTPAGSGPEPAAPLTPAEDPFAAPPAAGDSGTPTGDAGRASTPADPGVLPDPTPEDQDGHEELFEDLRADLAEDADGDAAAALFEVVAADPDDHDPAGDGAPTDARHAEDGDESPGLSDLEDDLDGEDWKWIGEPPLPEADDDATDSDEDTKR